MCCFYTILIFLGPRFASVIWWIAEPLRWSAVFPNALIPILGILFLPWTTLMYALVAFNGLNIEPGLVGWDWLWIGLAFFADISMYAGGGYRNRDRIPGQAQS
jgi:hypothetical protein